MQLELPSPAGSGMRRGVSPSMSPTPSRMRGLLARSASRMKGSRASCTPATAPASSPMRRFSATNGSVSSSPRVDAYGRDELATLVLVARRAQVEALVVRRDDARPRRR